MTVDDIMKNALALCGEQTGGRFFGDFALPFINNALCEAFAEENALRKIKKSIALDEIPKMNSVTEEIPYSDRISRGILTYLMARQIALVCDNTDLADRFAVSAEKAKQSFATDVYYGEVEDFYSGDDIS